MEGGGGESAPPGGTDQSVVTGACPVTEICAHRGQGVQGSIHTGRAGRKRRGASEHVQSCVHKMSTHCPHPRPGRGAKTMEGGRCHFPIPRTVLEAPAWAAVLPRSPRCLWVAPSLSRHSFLVCEIRMLLPPSPSSGCLLHAHEGQGWVHRGRADLESPERVGGHSRTHKDQDNSTRATGDGTTRETRRALGVGRQRRLGRAGQL